MKRVHALTGVPALTKAHSEKSTISCLLHKIPLTHCSQHPAEFSLHKKGHIKGCAHNPGLELEDGSRRTRDLRAGIQGPGAIQEPRARDPRTKTRISTQMLKCRRHLQRSTQNQNSKQNSRCFIFHSPFSMYSIIVALQTNNHRSAEAPRNNNCKNLHVSNFRGETACTDNVSRC